MANEPGTSVSVYMIPGQSVRIAIPAGTERYRSSNGFYVRLGTEPPEGYFTDMNPSDMLRGFVSENKNVGTLSETSATEAAVIYTHRRSEKNAIWFFAQTGEIALVDIISVPIHDHSSIVQGGPAYGTYFDDDEEAT